MGTISKTAKASTVKEAKRSEVETPEQLIRKLRIDLAAGLYVPGHRIQALLNAHDTEIEANKVLKAEIAELRRLQPDPDDIHLDAC